MQLVDKIIAFEDGQLEPKAIVEMFSELVKTDMAWKLQGFYGRYAKGLIDHGFLDATGKILKLPAND